MDAWRFTFVWGRGLASWRGEFVVGGEGDMYDFLWCLASIDGVIRVF